MADESIEQAAERCFEDMVPAWTEIPVPASPVHADITIYGSPKERTALWAAMGRARVEFEKVTKSIEGQTGQQKFRYASFAQLSAAMVAPLAAEGLAILQMITTPTEGLGCITTLLAGHGAELWVVTRFATTDNEHGFQATIKDFGAQTTYYKRYQLQAIGFIEGDRDADQDPRDMPGPNRSVKDKPVREIKGGIVDDQMAELMSLAKEMKWSTSFALGFTSKVFGKARQPDSLTRAEATVLLGAMRDERDRLIAEEGKGK